MVLLVVALLLALVSMVLALIAMVLALVSLVLALVSLALALVSLVIALVSLIIALVSLVLAATPVAMAVARPMAMPMAMPIPYPWPCPSTCSYATHGTCIWAHLLGSTCVTFARGCMRLCFRAGSGVGSHQHACPGFGIPCVTFTWRQDVQVQLHRIARNKVTEEHTVSGGWAP